MMHIKGLLIVMLSVGFYPALGDHHGAAKVDDSHYVLHSTFEIASGQNPDALQEEIVAYQKSQEANGFNNCGLYKHEYGSARGFYGFCYFDDFAQLDAIMKKEATTTSPAEPQTFAHHDDNILEIQQRQLKASPPRVVHMVWRFGSNLTMNERQARADRLFDVFSRGFGACNLYHHAWGSDLGHYMTCGYRDYTDFGKKYDAVNKIMGEELMDANLDILEHSDELLVKIMD